METLLAWLLQYGYAGLFALLVLGIVGLPVPDETLLAFSGYLISKGKFHPTFAFAAAFAGSVCGISLSYLIGRTAGYTAARRYGKYVHLTEERLQRVHRWFDRIGEWVLAVGYFIPGVRHFTALVAGMSKLEYRKFAVFAYAGAAVWVSTFLSIGYLVGENWQAVMNMVQRYTVASLAVIALCAGAVWWLRKRHAKPVAELRQRKW
jgi:membrane protein DedA with SNARE-associated domain